MPNYNRNITETIKGQVFDFHPIKMSDGTYAFALNAVVEDFDGIGFPIIQNEKSNILAINFPSGSTVVGSINIVEQNRVLWLLAYPGTGVSEIGETLGMDVCRRFSTDSESCDDCSLTFSEETPLEKITQTPCASYRTIQKDAGFNFNPNYPITSIQYRILNCSLQVFFTSDNNPRRWLEFNYINDDSTQGLVIKPTFYQIIGFQNPPCDTPIYGPNLDINALNVQPNILMPCIEFNGLVSGGSNRAGVYQFFVAMADIKGNRLSSFLSATNPIPIFTKEITNVTNYITDRAISLTIQNLDPTGTYQYYNLAVAKTIDNVTSFFNVGTFPVTQNTYSYTGNNSQNEPALAAVDIFTLYPYYKNAAASAQSNGILYYAGVKEYNKPNWQRVANEVKLYWQTIAIPEEVYRDPKNAEKFRSCMRDEVYPYAIQFIYAWGEETNGYHIPGRQATALDLQIVQNNDVIPSDNCSGTTNNLRWQVYNTATILGGDLAIYDDCGPEVCYQYGNFSYWESTEKYPNNPLIWGELCGQPIRHHKFPDSTITHIHNRQNAILDQSGGTFVQKNIIYPIGVKVDHDSVRAAITNAVNQGIITAEDAGNIIGYRILRGDRFGNKSIVAKGLLYDVNQYQRTTDGVNLLDQQPVYFANYPYNDLRPNPFLTTNFKNYDKNNTPQGADLPFTFSNRYTFHSPDTHFNQPGIGTELKLETVEYGQAESFYNLCRKQAKEKLLSELSYAVALGVGIINVLTDPSVVPNETATYTVRGGHDTWDETIPLMQFTNGTSSTSIPATGSNTVSYVGGSINVFNRDTGVLEPSLTPPVGYEYTVSSYRGGFVQMTNPAAITGTGALPASLGPIAAVAQGALGFLSMIEGFLQKVLVEMNAVIEFIKSIVKFRDWHIQFNSIGNYNSYSTVNNNGGVKRRLISSWAYLDGNNEFINELVDPITGQTDAIKFNNLNREDSVYLKYVGQALPDAGTASGVQDISRTKLSDAPFLTGLNSLKYLPISSYYASIKNYVPDQYGTIYNIKYLRTGSCYFDMHAQNSGCTGVYGGDTFINRFAFKKKVPYFLGSTFNLPNGTDFDYSQVPNLAFPRYYFNNTPTVGSNINVLSDLLNPFSALLDLYNLLGGPNSIRDCAGSTWFDQSGYIYLYHYGIPYFFAESDYNVDYRYGIDNLAGDFYPHQGDLNFWLQEENVPITEQNQYHYNNSYSKQNLETSIAIDAPDFIPARECDIDHPNRIIYSDNDNWLVFKADNFTDFPLTKGRITSLEGIENQTVLVRTENSVSVFKSILRLPVEGQIAQLGNGSIFSNPPQDFAETTLGYIGSQHRCILHTEYGHISADAKRGQVFNIGPGGSNLDEISKDGMKNWFKENLPFRLLRDFKNMPEQDVDNALNGAGLIMCFDKRHNRFLITKKDWKRSNPNVQYDPVLKQFYIMNGIQKIVVSLGDPVYFVDCSWTMSYNFWTKSWISFHSYKPNYYIDFIDYFGSGINGQQSSFWAHDLFNGSFQVFYGNLQPFVIEPIVRFEEQLKSLLSVMFDTEVRRYSSEFDYAVRKDIPGFNKAIIYNDIYNSGLMNLIPKDPDDFSTVGLYPFKNSDSWNIEVSPTDFKWAFDQFYGLNKEASPVPMWLYAGNNAEKSLNPSAFDYSKNDFDLPNLKGQWFKTRFINDLYSNYKIFYKFQINDQLLEFR